MKDGRFRFTRRDFLRLGLGAAAGTPLALSSACGGSNTGGTHPAQFTTAVAIVACKDYGSQLVSALQQAFSLLGGIGTLVKGKTVTVKINLTCSGVFDNQFGLLPGESYITDGRTAIALASSLLAAGATRVRFVDSVPFRLPLDQVLALAQWDVAALLALGNVELENTRNLGAGASYSRLTVPGGGYLFSYFDMNHCYQDADVYVSMAKMKQHLTAGITLSTKNLFGATPNSLYGTQAGNEDAIGYRGPLHGNGTSTWAGIAPPGANTISPPADAGSRIPRILADLSVARPMHLAIIDGIASMSGGEGPWAPNAAPISPGVLVVGTNPISTDAVSAAVMGYPNPRAPRGIRPFQNCDNHLLLAEQAGAGTADLSKIEVRGLTIAQALCPYPG